VNRLVLSARVVERGALRYTPAGIPALDLALKHESEVSEDGHPRKVSLEVRALAIGEITQAVAALALGASGSFGGFVAAARNGRGLRFHITEVGPGQTTESNT
jgi:primosomal replication protein N